jgi:hypothetical protein
VDFAEEQVDDDGEDPEEEIVYDVVVCFLAFVGHGGRGCCSCRALSCVCLACILCAMVEVEGCGPEASRVLCGCVRLILGAICRCREVACHDEAKSGQTDMAWRVRESLVNK